jgi:hypothetical protein
MSKKVICQKWEESERGWGTRPDGYSLHVDEAARLRFVAEFWRKQKQRLGEETPDEYSRQCGAPFACPVSDGIYKFVKAQGDGVFVWKLHSKFPHVREKSYPWPGGTDGWCAHDASGLQRLDGASA